MQSVVQQSSAEVCSRIATSTSIPARCSRQVAQSEEAPSLLKTVSGRDFNKPNTSLVCSLTGVTGLLLVEGANQLWENCS